MNLRKTPLRIFLNGMFGENPVFRLAPGLCPALAVATTALGGVGIGLAATFVLVFSSLTISLMRKAVPEAIRIPVFVMVIAAFVTVVQLFAEAFTPVLHKALGIYIPLLTVNCIVFARAEAFAFKNPPLHAAVDGLGAGAGFTLAITLLAALREVLGAGALFGAQVMPASYPPMTVLTSPPGGFILLGLLLATVNPILRKLGQKAAGA